MGKGSSRVYQFKITLKGVRPPIWRRVQVPEFYTFWDLHVAIQDAMGWLDYHLHEFEIIKPSTGLEVNIGIPDDGFGRGVLSGWRVKIANYFSMQNRVSGYTYDFGDNWEHVVRLEEILPRDENMEYPRCIAGRRACPPEDCGGVWGYERLLGIINDAESDEYEETLEWVGDEFKPEHFDLRQVRFTDPRERLRDFLYT